MSEIISAGLLSKKQRKYLLGEHDPNNEATMRFRIRRRIQTAMLDFRLLYASHPDEERKLTFEPSEREQWHQRLKESEFSRFSPDAEPEKSIQDSIIPGMRDSIAYFYLAARDRDLEDENFAEMIRNGVKQAIEHREGEDVIARVEVSIDHEIREERLSELREKFLEGEQLSKDQLKALLDSDPSVIVDMMTENGEDR